MRHETHEPDADEEFDEDWWYDAAVERARERADGGW